MVCSVPVWVWCVVCLCEYGAMCVVGDASDGDDVVRFALGLLDHVKTTRLSKEVGICVHV